MSDNMKTQCPHRVCILKKFNRSIFRRHDSHHVRLNLLIAQGTCQQVKGVKSKSSEEGKGKTERMISSVESCMCVSQGLFIEVF